MWGEGETGMMMEVTFSRVSRSTSRICMQESQGGRGGHVGRGGDGVMMEVTFSRVSRSTSRICMQGGEGHDAQTPGSGPGGRDACSLGGCMQGGGGRITIHVAGGDGKEWMSRREPCLSQWG